MESIRASLALIPVTKVLEYSGFKVANTFDYYVEYTKYRVNRKYYVFRSMDNELRAFDQQQFSILDRLELFFYVVNVRSREEVDAIIKAIETYELIDDAFANLPPTEEWHFINKLVGMRRAAAKEFSLVNSQQFHNRVFATHSSSLVIPLYHLSPSLKRSDKIVNFVKYKQGRIEYFNDRTDWLTATCYQNENRTLILTCDPDFWLQHLTSHHGPDYMMILCHPTPAQETVETVFSIMDRLFFPEILIPASCENDLGVFATMITHFLNNSVEGLFFEMQYDQSSFELTVFSGDGIDHAEFFADVTGNINEAIVKDMNLDDLESMKKSRNLITLKDASGSITGSKTVCYLSFSATEIMFHHVFRILLDAFGLKNRVKVCSHFDR